MPDQEISSNTVLSYDDIFNAIWNGSQLTTKEIVDLFDDEIDRFLLNEWEAYFHALDPIAVDWIDWSAQVKPELGVTTIKELGAHLGPLFDTWLRNQKVRLNLTVGADIPYLLTELAGGERVRGEYISQLIRGIIRNQTEDTPDLQAMRLEINGLEGRLRTLERRVDQLSPREPRDTGEPE